MPSALAAREAPVPPLRGELRYGFELARLLADRDFLRPTRSADAPPVLLLPGFMAGDHSLRVMGGWLRRRGSRIAGAGMLVNSDCAERSMARVEARLRGLAERAERPVVLIGQSRGGQLARVAAVRNPELVSAVAMLGSPVLDPLNVGPAVLGAVRSIAWLGDRGVPWMLSHACGTGPCCLLYREDLRAPLPEGVRALSVYSRSDGIVSWEACLDPCSEQVEVESSHGGMSVHLDVYRTLAMLLDEEGERWTG